MDKNKIKAVKKSARHKRIRKKIVGSETKPRLCVYRSLNNMHAQLVDDLNGKVLLGLSTQSKDIKAKAKNNGGNVNAASLLGASVADLAKNKGIIQVCFDRGGHIYHGRIKAFAEAARKNGLQF